MHVSLKLVPVTVIVALEEFDYAAARKAVMQLELDFYTRLRYYRLVNRIEQAYRKHYAWLLAELDKEPAADAPVTEFVRSANQLEFESWDVLPATAA